MLYKNTCRKCGARRIDNQIGLEPTVDEYVAKLVDVFREVRRVLHPTGTVWCNLGDSYAATSKGTGGKTSSTLNAKRDANGDLADDRKSQPWMDEPIHFDLQASGLKPKDLIGVPWRVAFALQADGWYLRSDIIWAKKNCMPESVSDRPTKSHEYIFLLSKASTYYYDADAIREPQQDSTLERLKRGWNGDGNRGYPHGPQNHLKNYMGKSQEEIDSLPGRNKRSVWTVTTKPYSEAHFATFPPDLIEPCILAGTSAHGCCSQCGAPWERVVEREMPPLRKVKTNGPVGGHGLLGGNRFDEPIKVTTTGWRPTCTCFGHFELIEPPRDYDDDGDETVASQLRPPRRVFVADGELPEPVPCTVLDPFLGSGTTLAVALKHGRRGVGCELNPEYVELAHDRIRKSQPLLFSL